MANDPILHLLGLAKKAGRLEIGEEPVGAVCRSRHARLLLLASDAAPNTCRRAAHFGEAGGVLWLSLPCTKAELGLQLGRSSCAMLALTDAGFAATLVEKLAAQDPEHYGPAAQQLRTKADRMLQRQREKRQHEKNLQQGKKKPWAPPPPPPAEASAKQPRKGAPSRPGQRPSSPKRTAKPTPPGQGRSAPHSKGGPQKAGHPPKPGPGGRRLSGKFRP
jgi:ribosomal protein L7Ae-like RNA K-turn-binding protein